MIQKAIKHIIEQKIDLHETRITTYTSKQFLFGGVSLAPEVDNLFDPEIESDDDFTDDST